MYLTSDLRLPRRIERADAASAFRWASELKRLNPKLEVAAEEHCGGCALFGGVGSPYTHAMGAGMAGPVTSEDLDGLENFYREKGSAVLIDLCPLADAGMIEELFRRGYRVIEFNNLLVRNLAGQEQYPDAPPGEVLSVVTPSSALVWSQTVSQGFANTDELQVDPSDPMSLFARFVPSVLALDHGEPVAGASMNVEQNAALFCGDATRIGYRGRGLQNRLIQYRLAWAREMGCDLAYACVIPGSQSHKNYEKAGFQLLYMRVNLAKD